MKTTPWDTKLRSHKFIVFAGDHFNPLNVIRSLGEKGIYVYVILVSQKPCMIPHCRYIKKLHRVHTHEEGYRILITEYGQESHKPFVLCSDDTSESFLDLRFEEVNKRFFFYNAGERGRVSQLQNKDYITNLAAEIGLTIPQKEVVETGVLPTSLTYPIITKALVSTMEGWKNDVFICHTENELKEAYTHIKSKQLILQEYIEKAGEFCIEGFAINDGKEVFMPYVIDYIRFYKDSYGHYMTVAPLQDQELRTQIHTLLRATKYNGIFEVEFMKGTNGEIYFLEINFRTSAWLYALTTGGGNLPYFWTKATLSGIIHEEEMELRTKPFKAMSEPADFVRSISSIGLFAWLKDLFSTECLYYWNKKDPKPFFYYVLHKVLNKFHTKK